MPEIGLIFNGVWSHYTFATALKYKNFFKLLYVYDLEEEQLNKHNAVFIPFQSNQKALSEKKELLYNFLKQGKKIFVEGDSSAD